MDDLTQTLENIPVKEEITETKDFCIKIWKEFCSQKITQKELRKELAYITISSEHGWGDLRRKPSPTRPSSLVNYFRVAGELAKNLQFERKDKLKKKTFQDMRIVDYIKQLPRTQAENMKTIYWLRELKDIFDKEGDIVSRGKVQMRIEEFLSEGGEVEYNRFY